MHVGSSISHYRIVQKLGEGGMGIVYKAEDTTLDRPVALKFLAEHLLNDAEAKERFLREAKAAAAREPLARTASRSSSHPVEGQRTDRFSRFPLRVLPKS